MPTTRSRRGKRSWPRRARRRALELDSEDIRVRWHSTDALPGDTPPQPPVEEGPVTIRGPEIPQEPDTRSAGRGGPAAPPPRQARHGGGRHRVEKKMWAPAPTSPKRRTRRAAVIERRRQTRLDLARRARPIVVGLVVVALAVASWAYFRSDDDRNDPAAGSSVGLPTVPTTALIAGTERPGGEATWLALLSYDPGKGRAAVVYVPAHTAVEVPGRGLQGIGGAMTGGLDLLEVSAHNLFPGLDFTHVAELTRSNAVGLFGEVGALTVDVPTEVRIGSEENARVLFSAGLQDMPAEAVASLLYTKGFEDDDVDLGARQLAVWDSLFDAYRAAPEELSVAVESAGRRAALDGDTASGLAALFGKIAAVPSDRLTLTVLPVEQVGVGGSELYDTGADELEGFVEQTLSATGTGDQITVQVLNGVGTPGVGEQVAKALIGDGYRVTLTGNVPGFGAKKTLVVTYDASPEGIAAAERARELLGAGEVQISGQGRVSVDLTVVVGKDFLKR